MDNISNSVGMSTTATFETLSIVIISFFMVLLWYKIIIIYMCYTDPAHGKNVPSLPTQNVPRTFKPRVWTFPECANRILTFPEQSNRVKMFLECSGNTKRSQNGLNIARMFKTMLPTFWECFVLLGIISTNYMTT